MIRRLHMLRAAMRSAALAVTLAAAGVLHAQPAGGRPIKLVVPTSAGSSADIGARALGERLQTATGRPVIIENKVGAGGSLAAAAVAVAEANGETVGILGNSYLLFPVEFPSQKFDPMQDVAPVALISRGSNVLVVAGNSAYSGVGDIVERARNLPGRISYASAGVGSSTYHSAERMRASASLDLIHVPYKGSPESVQEVIAGRVDFAFAPVSVAAPLIQSGRVKALAVSSSRRSALLPQVPTTLEAGLADSQYDSWLIALVPAKTPLAVQTELNRAFNAAVVAPEVRSRFAALGLEPDTLSLDAVQAFVRKEFASTMTQAKQAKPR